MEHTKLEVGMLLDKSLIYYHEMLINKGFEMVFSCLTHDVYYTNKPIQDFKDLTENQMKQSCIRLRYCNQLKNKPKIDKDLLKKEKDLIKKGYIKIFDTIKMDFQYHKGKMPSRIQLQDIKDVGLLVYYDNEKYDKFSPLLQREKLIKELNSYGFNFKLTDLGLDKLRTLYYKKKMFSENQNA